MKKIVIFGTVVVKDVPSYTTSVGNPSKVIKEHDLSFNKPSEQIAK